MAKNKNLLYSAVFFFILAGIVGFIVFNPQPSVSASPPDSAQTIAFETIEKAAFGEGNPQKENLFITDGEEWKRTWEKIYPAELGRPDLLPIDWEGEAVIAVFQGERPTQSHFVEITKIADDEQTLFVHIQETVPGSHCPPSNAKSFPFHAVKISKIEKEVEFVWSTVKKEC